MDEVTEKEMKDATRVMGLVNHELRRQGLDANLFLEAHIDHITVEIRVRVPRLGIPIESVDQPPPLRVVH